MRVVTLHCARDGAVQRFPLCVGGPVTHRANFGPALRTSRDENRASKNGWLSRTSWRSALEKESLEFLQHLLSDEVVARLSEVVPVVGQDAGGLVFGIILLPVHDKCFAQIV